MSISKGLLHKARQAKRRAEDLRWEELNTALSEALEDHGAESEEYAAARKEWDEYSEEIEEGNRRKAERRDAKLAAKEVRARAGLGRKGRKIEWTEGGRELVKEMAKPKPQFHAAAQGSLSRVVRDIGRWETAYSYENTRGVQRGDLVMPVSEPYAHPWDNKGKTCVDVLVGDQLVRGIPAAALRPVDFD